MEFYEAHHPTSLDRLIRGKMGVPPTALLDALTLRVCDCDPRPPPRQPVTLPVGRSCKLVTFSAMRSLVGTRRRGRQECTPRLNPPQNGPGIFPTPERWITCHRRPRPPSRPLSSLATDLRPTAGDGAGRRFHFHNKKGQRTLPGFCRAHAAPIRSSDLN